MRFLHRAVRWLTQNGAPWRQYLQVSIAENAAQGVPSQPAVADRRGQLTLAPNPGAADFQERPQVRD